MHLNNKTIEATRAVAKIVSDPVKISSEGIEQIRYLLTIPKCEWPLNFHSMYNDGSLDHLMQKHNLSKTPEQDAWVNYINSVLDSSNCSNEFQIREAVMLKLARKELDDKYCYMILRRIEQSS